MGANSATAGAKAACLVCRYKQAVHGEVHEEGKASLVNAVSDFLPF